MRCASAIRSGRSCSTGIDAVAIVFLHNFRYPEHERRADTTVVDAYLWPIFGRYVQ
jgi:N-methylhydantoinase A/oxoprolinase/acetone carboxylase beta subunit